MMEGWKETTTLASLLDIAHPSLIGGGMGIKIAQNYLNGYAAQVGSLKHSFGYKSHRLEVKEPDSVPLMSYAHKPHQLSI